MRGSVYKRGSTYTVAVDLGRDESGRRRRKTYPGFATKREADTAARRILAELDRGTYVAPANLTVRGFLVDEWLPAKRPTVRATTSAGYRRAIDAHIVPALGDVELQRLTPDALNRFYSALLEGAEGRRPLAAKTVRNVHGVIRKALDDAVRWGKVARNVASLADPPKAPRPELRTWSAPEVQRFLAEVAGDRLEAAWIVLATTGMRRGEVLGLRWVDVDLDAATLAVVRSLTVVDSVPAWSEPKTAKGRRVVALDSGTVAALRAHRARQNRERLAVGAGWVDDDLVFASVDGSVIHPERFSQWFGQHQRRAGLPAIRLHDLRHTWATLALGSGVHPKIVSERLGHANIAVTLDLYSHVTPTMQRDAAATVAALMLAGDE